MSYTPHFLPGQGLHPKLILTVDAPRSACPLYTRIIVPNEFIVDRFQLQQLHQEGRLGSHDGENQQHGTLRPVTTLQVVGERDLEAPTSRASNASILLRIQGPQISLKGKEKEIDRLRIEVPLHLRYQRPVAERWSKGIRQDSIRVDLPIPDVFWACSEEQELPSLSLNCPEVTLSLAAFNAWDITRSIYSLRLGNSTAACALQPPLSLTAPTGVLADLPYVESGTFVAVWLGMLWICRVAFWPAAKTDHRCSESSSGDRKRKQ